MAALSTGLGIFNSLGTGLGIFSSSLNQPLSGNIAGLVNALMIPQNTKGLGIMNGVNNSAPVASLIGQVGANLVSQAVQLTGDTRSGITPIAQSSLALAQALGLPVAPGAASSIQAQGLTAGEVIQDVSKKIADTQSDNTLLNVAIGFVVLKLLKIF